MTRAALAVTGSTGYVGGAVARILAAEGIPLRLLVRDATRAPALGEVAEASYGDREATLAALDGVETLFMVSASESATRRAQHLAFVAHAREAGVQHIVYTSFFGAAPEAVFTLGRDHWFTEQAIRESGMDFTFLRDDLYLDFLPMMVGEDGVLRGPAADGRGAFVARDDVARVAATVLQDPSSHIGATYDLTGPEALTLTEVAAVLTAAGRQARFHNETIPEAYESRRAWDAPDWQYDAWVSTYTSIAAGEMDGVSSAVRDVTGRDPLSLAAFLAGER
ncbi:SDR family oxidoreductase [Microbacteriaceae bacterium VKM Ac-2855]|nr:SDR family oxidoreductase [Microbacteriaceae bacterium VKM Ac-2855]